jgi:DNA polymerase-3 subunit chi
MTRVDFYVPATGGDPLAVTCRLVHKAYDGRQRVRVQARDAAQAARLDELLWTFRQDSFIPHALAGTAEAGAAPVLIDHRDVEPDPPYQLLINLADDVPGIFSRFERVIEVVDPDPGHVTLARERWRFYRERGYPIQKIDL